MKPELRGSENETVKPTSSAVRWRRKVRVKSSPSNHNGPIPCLSGEAGYSQAPPARSYSPTWKAENQQHLPFSRRSLKSSPDGRTESLWAVEEDHRPLASWVAQTVKNLLAMLENWVRSLGQEDPLEKGMAMAWRIP